MIQKYHDRDAASKQYRLDTECENCGIGPKPYRALKECVMTLDASDTQQTINVLEALRAARALLSQIEEAAK